MKYLLTSILLAIISVSQAQVTILPVPNYNDKYLDSNIKEAKPIPSTKYKGSYDFNSYVSRNGFRDTISGIFSQFVLGNNVFAKNTNVLTAEIGTKDTRLSYNAAGNILKKDFGFNGIYNIEFYATGKENIANIFSSSKLQSNLGINLSGSFLIASLMKYEGKEAINLYNKRVPFYWSLKEKADILTNKGIKAKLESEINGLLLSLNESQNSPDTPKELLYKKLLKLQDSVEKFSFSDKFRDSLYDQEIRAFEKKNSKWLAFHMLTMDVKTGIGNEGFSYYKMVNTPSEFPVVYENSKRIYRPSGSLGLNYIYSGKWASNKLSFGGTISKYIGFDVSSTKKISESIGYDSLNVNRSFKKEYSAYKYVEGIEDTYTGMVLSLNEQVFFGRTKSIGIGINPSRSVFFNGPYQDKDAWDMTYSVYLGLSKKGDILNKNVLGISLKTPDLGHKLPKSFNPTSGERLKTKEKLEVNISFGLSLDKLLIR